jgi:hypothetical protein
MRPNAHRSSTYRAACIHCRLRALMQQLDQLLCAHHLCAGACIWLRLCKALTCTAEEPGLISHHFGPWVTGYFPTSCDVCSQASITLQTFLPRSFRVLLQLGMKPPSCVRIFQKS